MVGVHASVVNGVNTFEGFSFKKQNKRGVRLRSYLNPLSMPPPTGNWPTLQQSSLNNAGGYVGSWKLYYAPFCPTSWNGPRLGCGRARIWTTPGSRYMRTPPYAPPGTAGPVALLFCLSLCLLSLVVGRGLGSSFMNLPLRCRLHLRSIQKYYSELKQPVAPIHGGVAQYCIVPPTLPPLWVSFQRYITEYIVISKRIAEWEISGRELRENVFFILAPASL